MEVKFFQPHNQLKNDVLMYSYLMCSKEEVEKTKFLPDNNTSLTFFFNDNHKVTNVLSGNAVNSRMAFAGQYTEPARYTSEGEVSFINIDFQPWGIFSLFGIEIEPYVNMTIDAAPIFPGMNELSERLIQYPHNIEQCIQILDEYFVNAYHYNTKKVDERILQACKIIQEQNGKIVIRDLCREIGMSHTGFTTHFSKMIGHNPKSYARVARFNAVHSFLADNPFAGWNEIVHKFDYFDQNHFIREFKQFTGGSPKCMKHWEALFEPLKSALEEGLQHDELLMKDYRNKSLKHILYSI